VRSGPLAGAAGALMLGELKVRRIGLGGGHLPRISQELARDFLHHALDLGVNLLDTADIYADGLSEQRIADALHPYPRGLVVATKGGFVFDSDGEPKPNGHPDHLRRACEASLRRLRRETIDLYQLHTPDPAVPLDDSLGALMALRAEGKIREIGVSNLSVEQLELAVSVAPIVSLQNLLNLRSWTRRGPSRELPFCERAGIAFIAWQPLLDGRLAKSEPPLDRIAIARGVEPAQVALAWVLQHSKAVVPIPGTASTEHLDANVRSATLHLSDEEIDELEAGMKEVVAAAQRA
jgi:aryl-alcohol dehydrogenase-like predicted oxidoreductase